MIDALARVSNYNMKGSEIVAKALQQCRVNGMMKGLDESRFFVSKESTFMIRGGICWKKFQK
jgi:ribosomal protein L22